MMMVDQFMRQNGRQFVAMAGTDDEMDRMARTSRKTSELIECSDLSGRRYFLPKRVTDSRQRMEDR